MKNKLPKVSVIVLNYNGKKYLKDCFESLKKINYPKKLLEIIMVDNASSDDSIDYVKKNFPLIKIHILDKNYGFAEGNNKGAEIANGEYLVFLNNDTIVDKNWLIELIKSSQKTNIKILSSVMLDYNKKNLVLQLSQRLSYFGGFISDYANSHLSNIHSNPKFSFYPIGASMLIDKNVFFKIGCFDKNYFMYGEDVSLGWKSWIFGYPVLSVPTSLYWHKVRSSSSGGGRSKGYIYFLNRNRLINLTKYPERMYSVFRLHLLYFLVYSLGQVCFFIKNKNPLLISSIIKSYFSFFIKIPDLMKERKRIQEKRVISDDEMFRKGLYLNFIQSIRYTKKFIKEIK